MATEAVDLDAMSIEELEQHIQKLDEVKQAVREQQHDAHAVLDRKNAEVEAQRRYDAMSSPERAALQQVLETQGIESEEQVSEV